MWVRVVKGIYFPRCSILEARMGARASWDWSSILEGIDFFKEKMMWQIMNGEEVDFWRDRWIARVCLKDLANEDQEVHQRVVEFIDDEGKWKLEQVKERIGNEVIKEIEAIRTCISGGRDRTVWPSTKDGLYSVKAG